MRIMAKKESLVIREMKEMLAIASVLYVIFLMFSILKMAMLGQYEIDGFRVGTAIVASLIIAKVILIFEHFPIAKRVETYPKIYTVFLKSLIYYVGYVMFTILEHFIKGLIGDMGAGEAINQALHFLFTLPFILTSAVVFITFLFFSAFWVIRNEYTPDALYKLFFKK